MGGARSGAFTLIEVLVVIVVIGILIAAIGLVGGRIMHTQKVQLTRTTMAAAKAAIDQFSEENPLKGRYDSKGPGTDYQYGTGDDLRPSFGPYPPYQLSPGLTPNGLGWRMEPPAQMPGANTLSDRLWRDLGNYQSTEDMWANINGSDGTNDDIRGLYAYLVAFCPDSLEQVPQGAMKPLNAGREEFINPAGTGANRGNTDALNVLGIHDAWGVPLDYFLYVKAEYSMLSNGTLAWRITDRMPVLRSRGIELEVYEDWRKTNPGGEPPDTEGTRIYSDPMPAPAAFRGLGSFWWDGTLAPTKPADSGWARAVGLGDLYAPPDERGNPHTFGWLP